MAAALTDGAILDIFAEGKPDQPTVQFTELVFVPAKGPSKPNRYKCIISDGSHYGNALLAADMAKRVEDGLLQQFAAVKLIKYLVSLIGSTKVIIVTDMELVEQLTEKIGEPLAWNQPGPSATESKTPAKGGQHPSLSPETSQPSSRVSAAGSAAPSHPMSALAATPKAGNATPMAGRPTPIEALNPYSSKWTIRARVVRKEDIRHVTTRQGEVAVFSMDLCDESGEIRATCWREAAEAIHNKIEEGRVYLISRGQLKMANKRFSTLNNQYEMSLNFDSAVQLCADEPAAMPTVRYNFTPIAAIGEKPTNAVVDVIGVVSNISPVTKLTAKSGRELIKRTATIADDSDAAIEVTVWGSRAETFPESGEPVVALKGMRVTEWNQKSLGFSQSSMFEVDPPLEEAARIRKWSEAGGASLATSLSVAGGGGGGGAGRDDSSRSKLEDLKAMQVPSGESEFANLRACINRVNPSRSNEEAKPIWYAACPKCSKKALGDSDMGFNCEGCQWSGSDVSYRYILQLILSDSTGQTYVTAFNDQAATILGMGATQLKELKEQSEAEYEAALAHPQWQSYVFRLRCKGDTYQDVTRVRLTISRLEPVNFATEAKLMLKQIRTYPGLEEAGVVAAVVKPEVVKPEVEAVVKPDADMAEAAAQE